MPPLDKAENRRALRSVVQAVIALIVVAFVGWIIHLLSHEADPLRQIALALVGVIFVGTFFYGAENVTRAITLKASIGSLGGVEAGIGADEAAQVVADAAQDKADEVKVTKE